jgi:hypothetical protein
VGTKAEKILVGEISAVHAVIACGEKVEGGVSFDIVVYTCTVYLIF